MRYRAIPSTDLKPSVICMGGGPLSRENDDEAVFQLLDAYYKLGGNFIDSANVYGKWLPSGKNVCDINIGKWIKSRGLQDEIIITSKGAHPPLDNMIKPRLQRDAVSKDLDESLSALGCGCIDLYYLHRDDPSIPVETIIDYMDGFVREGRIRYFAASNWHPARIAAAQAYAAKAGKHGFCANQLMWSFAVPDLSKVSDSLLRAMDIETEAFHCQSGMAAMAYESQARGYFQKHTKTPLAMSEQLKAIYRSPVNENRYHRAARLAADLGVKLGDVTLGYVLNQPFPSFAIIGSRTVEQVKDSVSAAGLHLTPEQIAYLRGDTGHCG